MPKFEFGSRDPNELWKCPCGVVLPYNKMLGHRRGKKFNPACQTPPGNIYRASEANEVEKGSLGQSGDIPKTTPDAVTSDDRIPDDRLDDIPDDADEGEQPRRPSAYELLPDLPELNDSEAMAEWFKGQLGEASTQPNPPEPSLEDILGADFGGQHGGDHQGPPTVSPDDEYRIEQPNRAVQPFTYKVNVSIPSIIIEFYQWAKGQGWNVGDGSLSTFVAEQLLVHFRHCLNLAVVVVDRNEVEIIGG